MPKRRRRPMPARRRNLLRTEMTGRSVLTPASSLIVSWTNLPAVCKECAFTVANVTLQICGVDTATANKQTFGSCLVQVRQLSPNAQSNTASGNTIKSSKLWMIGSAPRKHGFRPLQVEYPESFRGDVLSIDCICPQEGWEIGAQMTFVILFNVKHKSQSEACKVEFKIISHTDSSSVCSTYGSPPFEEIN